jgi:dTDP-4-amino-4,6-dideoxygalactose transaminase
MIPLCDVSRQYADLKDEIDAAMREVAAAGQYILGPHVKAFERAIAAELGVQSAIGVGNGTDALHLVLRALGIGPGDEVITTPFTFIATAEAISLVGARPVFADIQPDTFNIDPAAVEAAVTRRTRAILPVHLFGQPCAMDALCAIAERHGLEIVEDCAQAIGARYRGRPVGTFGRAGCFSFFPSKNLGALGDAGMVVTDDPVLAERVEVLRRHGGRVKYHHDEVGLNSRLDELQAAILRVKLPHLDRWNAQRRQLAYHYNTLLADAEGVVTPAEAGPGGCRQPLSGEQTDPDELYAVYHQYTITLPDRDRVLEGFRAADIGCAVYYPVPLHRQKVYQPLGYAAGSLPRAERAARTCLSLPMFPELAADEQAIVAGALTSLVKPARLRRAA